MYSLRNTFIAFFLLIQIGSLKAQISEGGIPPSFNQGNILKSAIIGENIQPPDLRKLVSEDRTNDSLGKPYRIAYMIPADICMDYAGKWDTLATGEIIWRLKVTAPGASGIQVIYDNFQLPHGSKLFLYSEDKKFVIGAFTEQNNHPSRQFANEIIPGESCILEYVKGVATGIPSICISKIGYVYRGMPIILPVSNNLKSVSGSCEVNVRCSPEGDNWTDVKRSVTKIVMSGYLCSGTLLNNTAEDFKGLLSTAYHCVRGIESGSLTWVFYFNYEYSTCSNSSRLLAGNTMTGADIRAKIPIDGGSDAALLELTVAIPASYNTYWTGWDRSDTTFAAGACIHHPAGDGTKISTIRNIWRTSTWFGSDTTVGAKGAHFGVTFAQTANGYGVTEGGSSGSGIFSPDGLFHGQLSGGSSSCNLPYGDNLFGKLSYSWDKYGATSNVQLKPWLDPLNSGVKKLTGIDHGTQYGVFWSSSPPVILVDSTIQYKDESKFNPTAWSWTFEGGTPASSDLPNPVVKYTSPGLYNVSLTVTNDKGANSKSRTDYVYVKPKPVWTTQNTRFPSPARGIQGISVVDSSIVWAWAFDGVDPSHQILEYTHTVDGGDNWKADSIVFPAVKGFGMSNLYALSKDTAYAAVFGPNGGGSILQTTNGGKAWSAQTSASFLAPDGFPNVVYFFDRINGVCMGDPNNGYFEIYTTTNGGNNWSRIPVANMPTKLTNETGTTNYYDAKGDTIWFGTSNGRVYRSVNKGLNWTAANTGLAGRVDVKFRNAKVGFAIQSSDTAHVFALRKTIDGGITWTTYTIPSNLIEGSFASVPHTTSSWINVNSSIGGSSFSSDDGATFSVLDSDNPYTAVGFYTEFIGWAGSYNLDSVNGGIYKWDRKNRLLTDVKNIIANNIAEKSVTFAIQPNPARDYMVISSNKDILGDVKVSVINVKGMLMDHFTFTNSHGVFNQTFGLTNIPNGLYLVVIQGGATVETHKIVVQ